MAPIQVVVTQRKPTVQCSAVNYSAVPYSTVQYRQTVQAVVQYSMYSNDHDLPCTVGPAQTASGVVDVPLR